MHLVMEMNAFSAGDECIKRWRQTRLLLATNTFSAGDQRVYRWKRTRLKRVRFMLYI